MPKCPVCEDDMASERGLSVHLTKTHPERALDIRFWRSVEKRECWNWTRRTDPFGYGVFTIRKKGYIAHRWLWEREIGELGSDEVLDHLCNNPSCVRLDHLEVVSQRENLKRSDNFMSKFLTQTRCKNGHAYTPDNTRLYERDGYVERVCRACKREWARAKRQQRGR